jgi:hypothetical protein
MNVETERSMNVETGREIALIGMRLLDEAYMAWQVAESDAERALRAWSDDGQHRAAYPAYRAAVDREEAAALYLERLHELVQDCTEALMGAE